MQEKLLSENLTCISRGTNTSIQHQGNIPNGFTSHKTVFIIIDYHTAIITTSLAGCRMDSKQSI